MPNRNYANEWMRIACHDFVGAKRLFEASHFGDTTLFILHEAVEKALKALFAYNNRKIPRIHHTTVLYVEFEQEIDFGDIGFFERLDDWYQQERYPNPRYELPSIEEIAELLEKTQRLFDLVCRKFELDCKDCT